MSQTLDLNNEDEDTFERDLKEMLKEGPSLNDLSSTVQGGGGNVNKDPQNKPQAYIRPDNAQATRYNPSIPRSHSVPPATSNIPLSSPERNGKGQISPDKASPLLSPNSSKIETIKQWTVNTYKCTRQMVSERFGKASRTVDLELEGQIESLRDMQRKYANILRLARALANHFYHVVQTQRALGDCFADMSQKNPELQEEFSYNSETQKALCKNGETLLSALNFFISSVNTLCNKTMDDTLQTIRQYENARIEFDAYRSDLDALQLGPRDSTTMPRIDDAQRKFDSHREKYERLRGDVAIKLKFLDENRVKVMHKQLLLFHNATAAYFSGNQAALESTLKQFNVKLKSPNADSPSWLEQYMTSVCDSSLAQSILNIRRKFAK